MDQRLLGLAFHVLLVVFPGTIAAEPVSVRIAVPAPMSGPQAPMGRAVHGAAALVAADINAGDGVVKVEAVLVDDTCASAGATRGAEALAAAKFDAVIGYPCRASAQAVLPIFAGAGQILIATAPVVPPFGLTQSGPTVFRLPVAEMSAGQFLGRRMAAAPPTARLAMVRDKTQQAMALALAIDAGVRAGGRTVQSVEVFTGGDKAFGPIVARLKALGVTHVAVLAYPVEGGLLAGELAAALPDIEMFGPDYLATADTPLIAGEGASRLRVVLSAGDPLGAATSGDELLSRLKARDRLGNVQALVTAAAVEAYVDGVRRAGSTEPAAVAAALRLAPEGNRRYGTGTFDARGHRIVPYWALYRWSGDKLVQEP